MQAFTLDNTSPIPVKLQLKAQVKYQVLAGMLRPGDQLPPLRDLAAGLGVHLNTVVRAFAELEDEGYLRSYQGKGVFVPDELPGPGQGAALRSLLAGVLQSAREFGLSPEEMAMATLAHGQLARPPQAATNRLLLVGGSRADLRRLQRQLEAALPVLVVPVLADELAERVRPREFALAACTLFHETDLKHQLPGLSVAVLAEDGARAAFASLRGLPAGARVAVVAGDWLHAARIRQSVERMGAGSLCIDMYLHEAPPDAQVVVAAAAQTPASAAGLARGHLVITEPAAVPPHALAALRRDIGTPAGNPSVHVRSAWV
ncbi:MAG: GntR family transcriptional regulator [Symbiobacteriaceae bacterium]|jgi:DNA-binding transcriptional regulator YhcF (GntR family)|nr:GntR family transcriptional regulator [Symbiobacteriaceae bacterium]